MAVVAELLPNSSSPEVAPGCELVDAGVDWLTLTTAGYFSPESPEAAALRAIVRREWYGGQAGVDVRPWGWKGYAGLQFGPLSIGARKDGSIVRCSGPAARLLGRMPWSAEWTCTRIDIQMTVRLGGRGPDEHIRALEPSALGARAGAKGRPWAVRLVRGYGDGDALYLGSRLSPMYLRVYNKDAESGHDPEWLGCVRFEAELKNGIADRTFWRVLGHSVGDTLPLELLKTAFESRGIKLPWEGNKAPEDWLRVVPRETDAERQVAWLEKSVRPVVRKLVGQGLRADVLEALELETLEGMFTPGE